MSKKKSKKHLVLTDDNNQPYCAKCGRADFRSKQAAFGHQSQCKGYNAEIKKISRLIEDIGGDTGTNRASEPKKNSADNSLFESAPISTFSENTEKVEGTEPLPRPYLGPTLAPRVGREGNHLALEVVRLKQQNAYLQKIAFNHNQHYPPARQQSFSGPQDMVTSTLGDLMENKTIRMIVTLGAIAMLLNFVKDQFDKLDKKSKNKRD